MHAYHNTYYPTRTTVRAGHNTHSILERRECGPEPWVDLVKNFRKRFRYEAGLQKNRQGFRAARREARATRATTGNS